MKLSPRRDLIGARTTMGCPKSASKTRVVPLIGHRIKIGTTIGVGKAEQRRRQNKK